MILVICQRGNVRSATVATILRDYYGIKDVIAIGMDTTTDECLFQLNHLAQHVIVVARNIFLARFYFLVRDRLIQLDIGDDIWRQPMHPDLVARALDELEKTHLFDDLPHPFYPTKEAYLEANHQAYIRRVEYDTP